MSAPVTEPIHSARAPTGLLAASTLCWIWGIVCGIAAIGFGIAGLGVVGSAAVVIGILFVLLAVVYCVAGYSIRKRRLVGGWIGLISAVLLSSLQLLAVATGNHLTLSGAVGLAINLSIVLLLVLNWRYLQSSGAQVGA